MKSLNSSLVVDTVDKFPNSEERNNNSNKGNKKKEMGFIKRLQAMGEKVVLKSDAK